LQRTLSAVCRRVFPIRIQARLRPAACLPYRCLREIRTLAVFFSFFCSLSLSLSLSLSRFLAFAQVIDEPLPILSPSSRIKLRFSYTRQSAVHRRNLSALSLSLSFACSLIVAENFLRRRGKLAKTFPGRFSFAGRLLTFSPRRSDARFRISLRIRVTKRRPTAKKKAVSSPISWLSSGINAPVLSNKPHPLGYVSESSSVLTSLSLSCVHIGQATNRESEITWASSTY